jgi:hypothetical protein
LIGSLERNEFLGCRIQHHLDRTSFFFPAPTEGAKRCWSLDRYGMI